MRRVVASELRHRRGRSLALLVGISLATTAFTVLTGASDTQRLQVRATVAAHFRSAYDILVRPHASRTTLERRRDVVRPGALSGIFGGITLAQWRTVLHTPGLSVAAPIAVVGYVLLEADVPIDLTRYLPAHGRALFRVRVRRITDRGLTRQADAALYVYASPRPFAPNPGSFGPYRPVQYAPRELLAHGAQQPVCAEGLFPGSPWDRSARGGSFALGNVDCWSRRTGLGAAGGSIGFVAFPRGHVGALIAAQLPFVFAAIDPVQEARLDHLNRAVIQGRYLRTADQPPKTTPQVPVLAPSRPYVDESVRARIERLPSGAAERFVHRPPLLGARLARFLARQRGQPIRTATIGPPGEQRTLLGELRSGPPPVVFDYWTVRPTRYRSARGDQLVPLQAHNSILTWLTNNAYFPAPLSAQDRQFRVLSRVQATPPNGVPPPLLRSVGTFDPAKLAGFSSSVNAALDPYRSPGLAGADVRSRQRLGDRALLPNGNIAGYLTQPPLMLTNLRSLPAFEGSNFMPNSGAAPISAIRVRVAGVRGIDAISRERVRLAAQRIATRTGLQVDLTIGSSSAPLTVELPAGRFGRPALRLTEPWIKKGVALAILAAVDKKSLVLFALILVVCALFVNNAASAAVRTRRSELGVLAALGWTASRRFAVMIGEVATIGLTAGLLGALVALPVSAAAGVHSSLLRAALAIPAALLLALLAGAIPAARAARLEPIAAVRPAVLESHRSFHPRGLGQLALINALRAPGRTILGAASLAVGVCALTLLLAATIAFHNILVGTLLGSAVSVQVRGSDYFAVISIVVLGVGAVADVLYLNLLDRAGELATLRATGWDRSTLMRLVATEGLWIGALGSLTGAALGLAGAAAFAGALPTGLIVTSLTAALVGMLLSGTISILPAAALNRMPSLAPLAGD
ncbi:MAG: FtsX-like permease family protein [Solirubrobacteraceae bacterium]